MKRHDLVIIGTGSGNSILTPAYDGYDVAIVEHGVFGGTCLNRGCIPSKMLVHAADVAETARHGPELGVHTSTAGADWPAIRDRVFGRIDPISAGGEAYRRGLDNVTVYGDSARFVDHKVLDVGGTLVTGEHIVLAAGARPHVPEAIAGSGVDFHTSDTIMRTDAVPERLIIVGGGYIAAELAHVFGALGSEVTIVHRSPLLLRSEDTDIATRLTDLYSRRFDTRLTTSVLHCRKDEHGTTLDISTDGRDASVTGDILLVATGRVPNGDDLGVAATGVELDPAGYVVTDPQMHTNVAGIWALGDITNPAQLKHTANAEARIVAHNIVNPHDLRAVDLRVVPYAVFGHPQVAAVGATERDLRAEGIPYIAAVQPYSETAYGWALEDTESFCKVLAHAETRLLLGAHIVGPHASTLIQQLVQGMQFGRTVDEMAREQLYPHPALTEVVEQALLAL